MSSEYYINEEETLSIDERFGMLSLVIVLSDASPNSPDDVESPEVSPEKMVCILIRGLEACSYNMTDREFKQSLVAAIGERDLLPLEVS